MRNTIQYGEETAVQNVIDVKVAITSKSFSKNKYLRQLALASFKHVKFYEGDIKRCDDLILFLKGSDAVIVGVDSISRNVVKALPELKMISKCGVGLDNIDMEALQESGIKLRWKAGVNARSVAELTLSFMLGLMRNVFKSGAMLKKMQWCKEGGSQLTGKTVGIIGCGNIGKDVVRLLKPFACRVMVNDIVSYGEFYREMDIEPVSLEEVLSQSDIISLHVPLDASTRHMIRTETLRMMKKTAYLINTSRGGVVKTDDLKKALRERWIAAAALDVFETEPPTDEELLGMENLVVSPHIGGNAEEAVQAMGEAAVQNLIEYFSGVKSSQSRKGGEV